MNNLKRLHPAAMLISLIAAVKSSILPIIGSVVIGFANSNPFLKYVWIAILAFAVISSFLSWVTFYYKLDNGELYVQKGIFVKKKRYIQRQRVQSIDVKAGVLQRLFGMVGVDIETAGGSSEAEAHLSAITKEEAEAIRKELLGKESSRMRMNEELEDNEESGEEEVVEEGPARTWKLGTERLVAAAMTSSGVGLIFSAVGALFTQFYQFIPNVWLDQSLGFVTSVGLSSILAITGIVFLALLVSWAISCVITILKYGGFQVEQYEKELVITRGLLERRQLTLQVNRITSVRLVRNLLRQPLGFVSVYVESAGGGSKDEQASTLLIPILKDSDLKDVLADILPEYSFEREYRPLPIRALWKMIIQAFIVPVVVTAIASYFFFPYGLFGLMFLIITIPFAWFTFKAGGSEAGDHYVWLRYREISLIEVIAPRWKVQAAEKQVSVIQKFQGLSTFKITVQSSLSGKSFHLANLTDKQADYLLAWYSRIHKKDEH
ncbi:PH domain-containing protein [Alkalihalobacillus sp. FSL R5-0424]